MRLFIEEGAMRRYIWAEEGTAFSWGEGSDEAIPWDMRAGKGRGRVVGSKGGKKGRY